MLKFVLPAVILETMMIGFLALAPVNPVDALAYIAVHGAVSVMLSIALYDHLPARRSTKDLGPILYLGVINFVMPVVGITCVILGYVIARRIPLSKTELPYETVDEPVFAMHRNREGVGFCGGQVRAQLMSPATPLKLKMSALVSIQDTPARISKDLLRTLMADPADDIRLLAYGILDRKEKLVTQQILELQGELSHAIQEGHWWRLHAELAELYWELIYQGLVQGDLRLLFLDQVRHHAAQALQIRDDPGLWFLMVRLELHAGSSEAADNAIRQAARGGFARVRLLPYIAEICFLQKRFDDLPAVLLELAVNGGPATMAPVMDYWLSTTRIVRERDAAPMLAAAQATTRHHRPAKRPPVMALQDLRSRRMSWPNWKQV